MKLRPAYSDCPWYFGLPCALGGLALLFMTVVGTQSLNLGTAAARLAVGVLLIVLLLLAVGLLWFEGCPDLTLLLFLLPAAAALWLRLVCLDHQTLDYQQFLSVWVTAIRDHGGFAALKDSIGNYNVPYLCFLAVISYLPIPDLYLIKLFSVLFDVLLAWGGLRLARQLCRKDSHVPLLCFCLLLFLPTVALNGAYWGQCDSLYGALLLLAFSAALEGRSKTSVVLLAAAFSFKLQTVFLLPLWCVLWFAGRVKLLHLLLFPATYFVSIAPALAFGRPLTDILKIYFDQAGMYELLTMNSPSVYSFLPYGVPVDQTLLSWLGIAGAAVLVLALLAVLFLRRKQLSPSLLLHAAVILAIGVPFLLPRMHDRYFFLADVFTLVWACTNWRRVPIAALVQLSSLSCYSTYLNLRYTLPFRLGGWYFTMAFEGALMCAALVWAIVLLVQDEVRFYQSQRKTERAEEA